MSASIFGMPAMVCLNYHLRNGLRIREKEEEGGGKKSLTSFLVWMLSSLCVVSHDVRSNMCSWSGIIVNYLVGTLPLLHERSIS